MYEFGKRGLQESYQMPFADVVSRPQSRDVISCQSTGIYWISDTSQKAASFCRKFRSNKTNSIYSQRVDRLVTRDET